MRWRFDLALAFVATLSTLPAQRLVADIETATANPSSQPTELVRAGSAIFFRANDGQRGDELFVTDGTAAGTRLAADIWPGPTGSLPTRPVALGGTVYFIARHPYYGRELWKSDGTAAGTALLKEIEPGQPTYFAAIGQPVPVGSLLFFQANFAGFGAELWRSDGTEPGTFMLDLIPGPPSSLPNNLAALGSIALFTARSESAGIELWRTDGSLAGTFVVADIRPGLASSSPAGMTALGSTMYFAADDGTTGQELWKSDGTSGGTIRVADIVPGSGSSSLTNFTPVASVMFFTAQTPEGRELWVTDGTTAGTRLVRDIQPGPISSLPRQMVAVGNELLFVADDGSRGDELWRSDGTESGTMLVRDIAPGAASANPTSLVVDGGTVYFMANDGTAGQELWKSDGTAGGTLLVADIEPGPIGSAPSDLAILNGKVVFAATSQGDRELWHSAGTAATTQQLADLGAIQTLSSMPQFFASLASGAIVFQADTQQFGQELWTSDGTTAGTSVLKDIVSGGLDSSAQPVAEYRGRVLFIADAPATHFELWITDGTSAGTTLVKDLNPGPSPGVRTTSFSATSFRDAVYFAGNDGVRGEELWKTDGTAAGTVLVAETGAGTAGVQLTIAGTTPSALYFFSFNPVRTLWKTDGTTAGTVAVKSFPQSRMFDTNGVAIGDTLYFAYDDGIIGQELWKTDGTPGGTVPVKDIRLGALGSAPYNLITSGGRLFFVADNGSAGNELWRSDGTAGGTVLVKDIAPGALGSFGSPELQAAGVLVDLDGVVLFVANDSVNGFELWRTDGTETTTQMVVDLLPAPGASGALTDPKRVGTSRFVAFQGIDDTAGPELYVSDGTAAGTMRVGDIVPGPLGGTPQAEMFTAGDTLFFAATTPATGFELFAVSLGAFGASNVASYGVGCPGTGGLAPNMSGFAHPVLGATGFAIRLENGRPSAPAALFLGGTRSAVPIGGGCSLWLAPVLSLGGATDATGVLHVPLRIPTVVSLVGASLFATGLVQDPAGAFLGLFSVADGLQVVIGS